MNLTWINHASFIIASKEVKMITDPWLNGLIFNNSWDHLTPTKFNPQDFKDITHIWFSHEHPDHFFPPNVKSIPAEFRKEITVLFQSTMDKKVIDFCHKLDFKEVIEMSPWVEYHLHEDFKLIVDKVSNDTDSWMYASVEGHGLLNVNDCVFESKNELEKIAGKLGKVDTLLCQFSYANWVGNKDQAALKIKAAEEKLDEIKSLQSIFKPAFTIPFASFVWFCHEDNFHMNEQANKIDAVARHMNESSHCIVLYPSEEWDMKTPISSEKSIEHYLNDLAGISERTLTKNILIEHGVFEKSAVQFCEKSLKRNNAIRLKRFEPMHLFITDYAQAYSFSYARGLEKSTRLESDCDISLSASSMKYCFDFDWGFDTIGIAGTFEKPLNGDFAKVLEYQWVATLNNQGKNIGNVLTQIVRRIIRQIRVL